MNDCQVARRLGIPRTTIRDWRQGKVGYPAAHTVCPRCWRPSRRAIQFTDPDYAELLGLYLGDGHIVRTGRADRLRLFLDTRYKRIIRTQRSCSSAALRRIELGNFAPARGVRPS